MVRSNFQTASARARARTGRALFTPEHPSSPAHYGNSVPDSPPARSAILPEWHTSPTPSSSSAASSPASLVFSSDDSPSSRATTPATPRSPSPGPQKIRSSCSRRAQKDPNHTPRPPNSFILFRKKMCPEIRASGVERDNRIISRIFGDMWKKMSDEEKAPYVAEAKALAREHKEKYPDYRFSPQARSEPKKKRNVKRRDELTRQRVAVIANAALDDLESIKKAADEFDAKVNHEPVVGLAADPLDKYTTNVFDLKTWVPPQSPFTSFDSSSTRETAFRSPLLPPSYAEDFPNLASLSIADIVNPLSPLDLPAQPIQAPAMNVVPLPDVVEELCYPQTPDYSSQAQVPAYDLLPSHPQSSLALSDMYTPRTVPFMIPPSPEDAYAYGGPNAPYIHEYSDYPSPMDPSVDPTFGFQQQHIPSPDIAAYQTTYDVSYTIPDHSLQMQTAEVMHGGWSLAPNDFQPGYQQMAFAPAPAVSVPDGMQMQGYSEGLNVWSSYAPSCEMSPQGWP